MENGIMFKTENHNRDYEKGQTRRLVIPESLIDMALSACHDEIGGGHLGVNKTWNKIRSRFFWKNTKQDVDQLG